MFVCEIFLYLVMFRIGSVKGSVYVGGFILVNKNAHLGSNTNFNGMKILGHGKVEIGDNFHSGTECMMITESHINEGNYLPYDTAVILKDVLVQDNVWFGNRVLVLGGATIQEGAIIKGGCVVVSDIPALAIAGGNPAKAFKYRKLTHYENLKNKRDFIDAI